MGKQFYDIALYYWGEGTRRLIEGYERLNDSDAKRRINELYQEYKEAAKALCKVTKSSSKRAQLRLFGINLRLYSGLMKLIKH